MIRTHVALGLLVVAANVAAACAGASGEAQNADEASDKRETRLEHEECNLQSSTTAPMDADLDGRPEIIRVMDGAREICRAVDLNQDGVVDRFVYFDEQGRERRMESGFDTDQTPDEISYFEAGTVVRKERQTNHDGKIDTWDYYQGGRLVREERDSNADGYIDQWWYFDGSGATDCPTVIADVDGDGKPDEETKMSMCGDGKTKAPSRAAAPDAGVAASSSAAPASPEPATGSGESPADEEGNN